MPARLLLITLVMAACSGGGSLVPPPVLMFMLWLSRKRFASVPPVGCGGVTGVVGGATVCLPRATLPRCLPLPFGGSGCGCGSITGGGGGSGAFSTTAGAVSTTGGLIATTGRGGFFNEMAATTMINPITTSSPMIIAVVLPRPLVAASLASQPVALLTDIRRGGAPGTCTPP